MATNYIQTGDVLTVPAPANTLAGEVVIIGALLGVALNNAAETGTLDLQTRGVFSLQKVAADAFALGDPVHLRTADKLVTSTTAGNSQVGYAVEVAAAGSASVNVKLI